MRVVWVVLIVAACSADKPATPKPWAIQIEQSGGKPPGIHSVVVLGSDGGYRANGKPPCEVTVPADLIAPITAELGRTKLVPGFPADPGGSWIEIEVVTIGEEAYRFPSDRDAPALRAAFWRACEAAQALCPKPAVP